MANNIWSNYTEKTATPVDADEVMVYDSTDRKNKRLLFGTFWKWVAKKLNEATISELETENKTVIGALNYLNGNPHFTDVTIDKIDVSKGSIDVSIHPNKKIGLYILRISDGTKMVIVIFYLTYNPGLIAWGNANLYSNSSCSLSGNFTYIHIVIKADQIVGDEEFVSSCCFI